MQTVLQDLRYGIRTLAKTPAVAILIIVTRSLGIASSTLLRRGSRSHCRPGP